MAYMVTQVEVQDYEAFKTMFDAGRDTVRRAAKGHRILRGGDDPNLLFIQVEFDSAEDARAAREELVASGALERVMVKSGPTLAEQAEAVSYQ